MVFTLLYRIYNDCKKKKKKYYPPISTKKQKPWMYLFDIKIGKKKRTGQGRLRLI